MQRKAIVASLAIHVLLLLLLVLPGLITLSPGVKAAAPQQVVNLMMTAPPSHKTVADQKSAISKGYVSKTKTNTVEIPSIPNALIIQVDRTGFENIFAAAEHWHATLHSGVPYSDPGAGLQVFFCRPEDYGALKGRFQPGDAVWFSFAPEFRVRIFEKLRDYLSARKITTPPMHVRIGFVGIADFVEIRGLSGADPWTGACS